MVVVAHDVDEVEPVVHGRDVVGDVDGGGGGPDGRRQEEAGAAGVEGRAEVLEMVLLVLLFSKLPFRKGGIQIFVSFYFLREMKIKFLMFSFYFCVDGEC